MAHRHLPLTSLDPPPPDTPIKPFRPSSPPLALLRLPLRRRPLLLLLLLLSTISLIALGTAYLHPSFEPFTLFNSSQTPFEDLPLDFTCPNTSHLLLSSSPHPPAFLYPPRQSTSDPAPLSSLYTLFFPPSQSPQPTIPYTPRPVLSPPSHCLDALLTTGTICANPTAPLPKLDVVWTWVNGSDPLQKKAILDANPGQKGKTLGNSKLYRDHDELRHSLRSLLASFRPSLSRLHVLTADYPLPGCPSLRLGQVPQWLDLTTPDPWHDGSISLQISHHSQLGMPSPTFNSFAIEALLSNVPGVADNFLYMNDDYFFASPLSPSDFLTPTHGLVFRMQPDLLVTSKEKSNQAPSGEWNSLEWSNWLLDQRFGARKRPYVIHIAKSVSLPLLEEMSYIWNAELQGATAAHTFRGAAGVHDAYVMYMFPHFVVERHREALLWSWLIGRIAGDNDDRWGEEEMERAYSELGGDDEAEEYGILEVVRNERGTLDAARLRDTWRAGNIDPPKKTDYIFSHLDGYPYTDSKARNKWISMAPGSKDLQGVACKVDVALCLGTDGEPAMKASDVFKRVAFERPTCGDCIITALVSNSGSLGLSAFLPPPHPSAVPLPPGVVPTLPLTSLSAPTSFSLTSVLSLTSTSPLSLREFTTHLLTRYAYTLGDTPVKFVSLRSPVSARQTLIQVDRNKELALLCVNDDIVGREADTDRVMREWEGRRWGTRAGWERSAGGWFGRGVEEEA